MLGGRGSGLLIPTITCLLQFYTYTEQGKLEELAAEVKCLPSALPSIPPPPLEIEEESGVPGFP